MAQSIDALQIEISARATSANNAINRLTRNLDRLSTSLASINIGNTNGLVRTLNSLSAIGNTAGRGQTNITNLARALATLTSNASNIPLLTQSLSSLGRSLNSFMATMSTAPNVSSNTLQMTQALGQLARAGRNASVTASNLANLGTQLRNFMQIMSTAPVVNQNTIQMTQVLADLASQGSRAGRSSQSLVSGLNRTNRAMRTSTKSAKSLAAAFGKFYANYFLIIRGAKSLWSSIESTADYIEAYNYYNVAFGKIASEWDKDWELYGYDNAEAYAESFTGRMNEVLGKMSGVQINTETGLLTSTNLKNLGMNIQEITQYASQLASVTNSVGQTGEVSLAAASAFTRLGADISSLFNIDYSQAMTNLQSGLIGQSRALYKYGIDITNATLQTYAYNLGLTKAVSEMTQAEKMQLRMIAILDQSKVSWGDLANTIDSPSNQIRIFKNNLKETGMVLGQLFIPLVNNVLPAINGMTIAIKNLLTNIAGFIGIEIDLDKFGQGYTEKEDALDGITDGYEDASSALEEYKNQLLGFDEITKLTDSSDTGTGNGLDGGIDLTKEILDATSEYDQVWNEAYDKMENRAEEFADRIEKYLSPIGDVFKDFAVGDFISAGEDISKLVVSFNNYIAKAIDGIDGEMIGKKFADFVLNIDYSGIAKSLANIVGSLFETAWDFGWGIGDALSSWLVDNDVKDFWDFGSILGGDALSDKMIEIEKSLYGDPLKYIGWTEEHDANLQNITNKFKDLNTQAQKYLDLSNNYDTLSDEEKSYVKKMADDLVANVPGIKRNINKITGAWEGTNDELINAIDNQLIYAKMTANTEYLTKLYAELNSLEDKYVDLHGEYADMSLLEQMFGAKGAVVETQIETTADALESLRNQISYVETQNKYLEKQLGQTGDSMDGASDEADNLSGHVWAAGQALSAIAKPHKVTITGDKTNFTQTLDGANTEMSKFKKKNGQTTSKLDANTTLLTNGVNSASASVKGYKDKYGTVTTYFKYDMTGLKNIPGVSVTITLDTNKAKQEWDKFTQDIFGVKTGSHDRFGLIGSAFGISAHANGGFPEDGLFFANHTELVGKFTNGKTAVANNEQIVAGIQRGVYEAVVSAMSSYGGNSSGDVVVNIDGKQVFKAVQRQANNYTAQTGQSAFPI